jgi:hypothetical protein
MEFIGQKIERPPFGGFGAFSGGVEATAALPVQRLAAARSAG